MFPWLQLKQQLRQFENSNLGLIGLAGVDIVEPVLILTFNRPRVMITLWFALINVGLWLLVVVIFNNSFYSQIIFGCSSQNLSVWNLFSCFSISFFGDWCFLRRLSLVDILLLRSSLSIFLLLYKVFFLIFHIRRPIHIYNLYL